MNFSNAIAKRIPGSNSLKKIEAVDQAAVVWKIGVYVDYSCCIENLTLCVAIFGRRAGCGKCDTF